ncbi:MAG TPA: hypothetical protein VFI25_10265 [Planctomycetota bacterium]|nr:hypothetical protein [Planctomycetota bacterium]
MRALLRPVVPLAAFLALAPPAAADRLVLADGRVIERCFLRDEGTHLTVWERLEDVGKPPAVFPRREVKEFKIERDDAYDAHLDLPDLSVTFLELTPKLAGLHGVVDYDVFGRPSLGGKAFGDVRERQVKTLRDAFEDYRLVKTFGNVGEARYHDPERVVRGVKLRYRPGEEVTITAHVKNVGFAAAPPFRYEWEIDGRKVGGGRWESSLPEMEEAAVPYRWKWQDGLHRATFRVLANGPEIAAINDEATDPLWGWGLTYVVHPRRVEAWHRCRSAYGTFSFEDFYRWHLDIMNALFEASVYPSAPEGIQARVRLDRIVYADDPEKAAERLFEEDGLRYNQGQWIWIDDDDRKGTWKPPTREWRTQTEWSLPHELGHQLGLTDLYNLDCEGSPDHRMPDNGDPVTHLMRRPLTMMHWHGPSLWSEVCAGYLNQSWDKPRGHYGDFYFAIPAESFLEVLDVNGRPLPGARVEIFQRGVEVDPKEKGGEEAGVKWFPVLEDGNFGKPLSKDPVIAGQTDANGRLRLPNRPVKEVRTLNGFHRKPNPFGNVNVVGNRGLMLVRITKDARPSPFWLEITEFNEAWFRGQKDRFTIRLVTPYGSADSPRPPREVKVERAGEHEVHVTWKPPDLPPAPSCLDKPVGYRVWRRHTSNGLNDHPWFPVATVNADAREAKVDLRDLPADVYYYSKVDRFAVSSVGEHGLLSELVEVVLPAGK